MRLFNNVTDEDRKKGLLEMYDGELSKMDKNEKPFTYLLLTEGVRKLKVGLKPIKVEMWVVRTEKQWRKNLR